MPSHIDFEAKSEKELLILLAQQSNMTCEDVGEIKKQLIALNGTVRQHDRKIARMEGSLFSYDNPNPTANPYLRMSKKNIAIASGGIFFIISLISCGIQAFGNAMGWW